jgi:hypothetical protein
MCQLFSGFIGKAKLEVDFYNMSPPSGKVPGDCAERLTNACSHGVWQDNNDTKKYQPKPG